MMLHPGLWIAAAAVLANPPAPNSELPRAVDARLRFDMVASDPEIVTPTGIAVDARGRVLVIESHTHFRPKDYAGPVTDRIRLFEDTDADGRFDRIGTFFEGTKMTMNLAVAHDGTIFVATRYAVYRLEDRDGDGRADGGAAAQVPPPIVQLETPGDYPHNGLSGFAFDSTGNVYFGLGENLGASYRLVGQDGTSFSGGGEGGNIYRCRPDGTRLERLATGFWNPFHLAFDSSGRLFAVDNDPDSRPPCRLLHIVEGGDYGYRFRNGRKGLHPFTAWNGELPGTLPMVAGTGEAPSGILCYQGTRLPEEYRGSLLVTSWGDHRIERYRLQPRGASFRSTMEPVIVGGENFRPVGIAQAPDGSIYISDWVDKSYTLHGKGRIWRLRSSAPGDGSKTGRTSKPTIANLAELKHAEALRRAADPSAKNELLKALESDDPFLRQAGREGLKRSLKVPDLLALAAAEKPAHRLGALLVLRDLGRTEARSLFPRLLDDPEPSIRFVAIQWIGEERLEEYRPRLLAGLASSMESRTLFEATLAALAMLDRKQPGPLAEIAGEDYVAALLLDRKTPARVLPRALRMLRPDHPAITFSILKSWINSADPALRLEAARSLSGSRWNERFDLLARLARDAREPATVRAEAIAGLADDAVRHRDELVALAESGDSVLRHEAIRSLRGVPLSDALRVRLSQANRDDADAHALIEMLGAGGKGNAGEPAARSDLPPDTDLDAWLVRLEGPADPEAGERVFFHSKGPGCYRCHQVEGRGGRAGPDLSTLATGMTRRRLLQSILEPSREIAPQFVPWSVSRVDGTVFSGVLFSEAVDGTMTFVDSQGALISIKPDQIEERKPQTTSIMPEKLARTMTLQEFRDLLAFLGRGNGKK